MKLTVSSNSARTTAQRSSPPPRAPPVSASANHLPQSPSPVAYSPNHVPQSPPPASPPHHALHTLPRAGDRPTKTRVANTARGPRGGCSAPSGHRTAVFASPPELTQSPRPVLASAAALRWRPHAESVARRRLQRWPQAVVAATPALPEPPSMRALTGTEVMQ